MSASDSRPWCSHHVGIGWSDDFRYFATAEEALVDCCERNEAERPRGGRLDVNVNYYTSNALCNVRLCGNLALAPDGLCSEHVGEHS